MRILPLSWRRTGGFLSLLFLLAGAAACGGKSGAPVTAPTQEPYAPGAESRPPAPTTGTPSYSQAAPPPAGVSTPYAPRAEASKEGGSVGGSGRAADSEAMPKRANRAEASERPGLATHWGETRASYVQTTSFERAEASSPMATLALWYNDRQGAQAMAQSDGYVGLERVSATAASSGISFALQSETGLPLPGYTVGGRTYVTGEAGSRYILSVTNHTPARFEAVLSVDGLDVLDGRPASYSKRGYILAPYGSLAIDGFRQSESAVATFRFGSVRGSYAARKGDDRNVGVIGLALFHERGYARWPWSPAEVERRRSADPFPGRFATPPP